MIMENVDVEIKEIKHIKGSMVRMDIILKVETFGEVVVKGFRVSKSPKYAGEIWVQAPSINYYGKFYTWFVIKDLSQWRKLESFLKEKYQEHVDENPDVYVDEVINLDEIPI